MHAKKFIFGILLVILLFSFSVLIFLVTPKNNKVIETNNISFNNENNCNREIPFGNKETSSKTEGWCLLNMGAYTIEYPKEWEPEVIGAWGVNLNLTYGTKPENSLYIGYSINGDNTSAFENDLATIKKENSNAKIEILNLDNNIGFKAITETEIKPLLQYRIYGKQKINNEVYHVIGIHTNEPSNLSILDRIANSIKFSETEYVNTNLIP